MREVAIPRRMRAAVITAPRTCEVRTVETIRDGKPATAFLKAGDTVRIWAEDDRHHSIFGAIEQTVEAI